jgi:uncharacterized membrane protein YhaH (DUF805 family)
MDAFFELFSFEGRVNRAWYFWHVLLDDLVIFTTVLALMVVGAVVGTPLVLLPLVGAALAGIWAATAVTVKRFHDLGRSGWHTLGLLVPLYGLYLGIVLIFQKGIEGPNQYGPDPLQAARASGFLESPEPLT